MALSTAAVPDADALLCEGCGYVIGFLPGDSRCPECGKPLVESTAQDGRHPTLWESALARSRGNIAAKFLTVIGAFLITSARVIFLPARFFRGMLTRPPLDRSKLFACIHWMLAGLLYAVAADVHWRYFVGIGEAEPLGTVPLWLPLALGAFLMLWWTTLLAARLSAWEAAYRGLRLPRRVVLRAMQYHSAHYLPVALLAFATVTIFALLTRLHPDWIAYENIYLYSLCGEVVLAAAYLFFTYWTAMRNTMYANR